MPRQPATAEDAALVAAAVALCGSQAAAARAAGVSQPRLSRASAAGAGRALSEPQRAALRALTQPPAASVEALLGEVEELLRSPRGGLVLTELAPDEVYSLRIGRGWEIVGRDDARWFVVALGVLAVNVLRNLPTIDRWRTNLLDELRSQQPDSLLTATRAAQPLLSTLRRLHAAIQG